MRSEKLALASLIRSFRLIAVVGVVFTLIEPKRRPFSLVDPRISYPYTQRENVSNAVLIVIALVVPAVLIALICILFVPGPTVKGVPKSVVWRRKLWEWNTGWLGICLACAWALLITDGLKAVLGKPRPDLLARCNPNLANIERYAVGGYGTRVAEGFRMVTWEICQQTNKAILKDGFYSFPSGHSSSKPALILGVCECIEC